jgi:hypothetical protein
VVCLLPLLPFLCPILNFCALNGLMNLVRVEGIMLLEIVRAVYPAQYTDSHVQI